MQFLKWMKRSEKRELEDRVSAVEKRCEILTEQLTKQNETLQDIAVCLRRLAEVDDSLYQDILSIASAISAKDIDDDLYFSFREDKKDEYLN